jgi:hypothetical protein
MQTQAEKNRHQVIVNQIIAQASAAADEWKALGRKEQLQAWAEWMMSPPSQRVFSRFHRVLSVLEAVH